MKSKNLIAVFLLSISLAFSAPKPPKTDAGDPLPNFNERLKTYTALRDKLDGGAAALKETKDAAKIIAAQELLAQRIREARIDAGPGSVFSPEIQKKIRALLRPELKGKEGAQTQEVIRDANPGKLPLRVNARYPEDAPLSTVPPNVLLTLPKLPDELEYRFVGRHLILRDARANIIVDFILNVIP